MIRGRVLVIDGDEALGSSLGRILQERGYNVDVCTEAQAGFRKACETTPDCIVCNPELPDIDGIWVARRVRTESGAVAKVPILFVGAVLDTEVRTQALRVGVDVFLARPPVSNEEVAAQVDAIIAMAHRLEGEEPAPSSTTTAAAIRGDLSAFPLASLLMMFEMERRSGSVSVVAQSGKRATLTISDGLFASTEVDGTPRKAPAALREVLSWRAGRFSFLPHEGYQAMPGPRASVGAVVLEAMRLEDEEKGKAEELDPDELVEAADSRHEKVSIRSDLDPPPPPPPAKIT